MKSLTLRRTAPAVALLLTVIVASLLALIASLTHLIWNLRRRLCLLK